MSDCDHDDKILLTVGWLCPTCIEQLFDQRDATIARLEQQYAILAQSCDNELHPLRATIAAQAERIKEATDDLRVAERALNTCYDRIAALTAERDELKESLHIAADKLLASANQVMDLVDTAQRCRAERDALREQLRSMRQIAQGCGPFCERCGRGEPGPNLAIIPPLPNEKP